MRRWAARTVPQPPDVATGVVLIGGGRVSWHSSRLTMTGLFFYLKTGAPGALRQATEHPFPEPALQKKPQDDLKRFELEQRMALSGYGWVDRSQGHCADTDRGGDADHRRARRSCL